MKTNEQLPLTLTELTEHEKNPHNIWNPGNGLEQGQKSGRVKPFNRILLTGSPMAILVCIHLYNLFTSNYVLDISFISLISLNYSTTHNNSVGKKISNKTGQTVSAEYPSLFSAKDHC
jgi:hypothetical protein